MSKQRGNRVGMPVSLLLDNFGAVVADAFDGQNPYQVGSSLFRDRDPHDVDVRLLLDDERYAREGYGDPEHTHTNPKWVAMTLAFSALGQQMTGLPIDFQIQQQSWANAKHPNDNGEHPRSALGIHAWIREHHKHAPDRERTDTP